MKRLMAMLLVLLGPAMATAQDEMPALPDDQPAVNTEVPEPRPATRPAPRPAAAPAATPQAATTGTTVIGEKEAPIGLYIMPWRQSQAEAGLDRPARLLDEQLRPLDPEVFRRQVEYHRALTQHLEKTGRATP